MSVPATKSHDIEKSTGGYISVDAEKALQQNEEDILALIEEFRSGEEVPSDDAASGDDDAGI
jgi:hypothetical protein